MSMVDVAKLIRILRNVRPFLEKLGGWHQKCGMKSRISVKKVYCSYLYICEEKLHMNYFTPS